MTWQWFIFISVVLNSISTLLQRVLLVDSNSQPKAYAVFFQIFTGLLLGLLGLIITDMSYAGIKQVLPNLGLMTLLYGLGTVSVFKALKNLEASEFTIIFSAKAWFTILASAIVLQEKLLPKQILGSLLIFAGIVIVNIESVKKISFSKKEGLGLMAAALFGLAITNDRIILNRLDIYPFLFIAFLMPGLFIALINPKVVKKMNIFLNKKILSKMLLMSTAYAGAAITFYSGFKLAPTSSQAASFNLTSVIVTVLLAVIFLKERGHLWQKLLAAVISFAGLVLIS